MNRSSLNTFLIKYNSSDSYKCWNFNGCSLQFTCAWIRYFLDALRTWLVHVLVRRSSWSGRMKRVLYVQFYTPLDELKNIGGSRKNKTLKKIQVHGIHHYGSDEVFLLKNWSPTTKGLHRETLYLRCKHCGAVHCLPIQHGSGTSHRCVTDCFSTCMPLQTCGYIQPC